MRSDEIWIQAAQGRLYAKRWQPDAAAACALPPVILFHDSLGSVELWREFPERLALTLDRPVIAYDRLGFGKSDPYPGTLALSFIGDEADGGFKALRGQLGFNSFIAFGHSVGGCMAVGAAARLPQACLAVVTESAQSFVEDRTRAGIIEAKTGFARPGQIERLARYHGDKARWVLDAWTETWLSPAFRDWTLDADLQRLRCPLLALHGENDEYGSPVQPRRIAENARGVMRLLPGCGHLPHREQPEAVLGAVAQWLQPLKI